MPYRQPLHNIGSDEFATVDPAPDSQESEPDTTADPMIETTPAAKKTTSQPAPSKSKEGTTRSKAAKTDSTSKQPAAVPPPPGSGKKKTATANKKTAVKPKSGGKRAEQTGGDKKLVIVESPTKARTITRYLDKGVIVESSLGHIRDLPNKAEQIPSRYRSKSWARLGVDVDNDFAPIYINTRPDQIKKIRAILPEVGEVLLATDEDREGEAIAWHLQEVLKPKVPVRRMVFHEITKTAIEEALANTRELNEPLFRAQESRRILDRLYGFEVSPVLWKKVMPRLSAGRVQSVAVRLIIDRERARREFVSATYFKIAATFSHPPQPELPFVAPLIEFGGKPVASSGDFDSKGKAKTGTLVLDNEKAESLADQLTQADYEVENVTKKPYSRRPQPPFRTSTLQIESGRKLRFSAERTMLLAQQLYEKGYITYMRTDSTTLSAEALRMARAEVEQKFGKEFLPPQPRTYERKVQGAQEAHEAIRPAGDTWRDPETVAREVTAEEARLYDLIWRRTLASQMLNAKGETVTIRIGTELADQQVAIFRTGGTVITFLGFLAVYADGSRSDEEESRLPELDQGDGLDCVEINTDESVTKPPARYTEATLVEMLEEQGIGRPSTYASIMSTIINRGYVWKKSMALIPTFTAFVVVRLLEQYFPTLIDYEFTAEMESSLDLIATGEKESRPYLSEFYFGDKKHTSSSKSDKIDRSAMSLEDRIKLFGRVGLQRTVEEQLANIDAREINALPLGKNKDGIEVEVRVGRYGPFLQRGEDTVSIPDDFIPDEMNLEIAEELLDEGSKGPLILGEDPETNKKVSVRIGRYGPYVQLDEPEDDPPPETEEKTKSETKKKTKAKTTKKPKPKRASLLSNMSPESVTLEQALQLLSLPRSLGGDPKTEEEVLVFNGRYGPYLQRGSDRRSLASEDEIFTITMDQAQELLSQPPRRRGQRNAGSSQEIGETKDGKKITLRSGRYGPYVTDGEVNASLRKGDDPKNMSVERAIELLAERRERIKAKA